jgi:hypothetical protein
MLTIGARRYSLDDLRFAFEVASEDNAKTPTCKLTVTNLAPSTRAALAKGDPVILSAGYAGDMGTLFVGQIMEVAHDEGDLDVTTKITAVDSLDAWLGKSVNKTYKGPITAKEIIDDLLEIFGIEISLLNLAANKSYPRGRVCVGKLKAVLTDLVVGDCKSRLLLRTSQIIILPPEQGVTTGYMLTPQTGLLKTQKQQETQTPNTKGNVSKKSRQQQTEADGRGTRECLLNYRLGIGDHVAIQDQSGTKTVKLRKVGHKGDRDGDWKTILEVEPI